MKTAECSGGYCVRHEVQKALYMDGWYHIQDSTGNTNEFGYSTTWEWGWTRGEETMHHDWRWTN